MSINLFPLSDKWIPNELLVRDKQLKELLDNVGKSNFWICGDKGLGKSLTAKIFTSMVDGYLLAFTSQAFRDGVREFALKHGVVPKTREHPITTLMSVFKNKTKQVVIVFDDVDKLGRYLRRDFSLYLHDLHDRMLEKFESFSIHVITTIPFNQINSILSPPAKSRLRFKPLIFPRYTKDEIIILLKQRLSFIPELKVEEEALEKIADFVSRIGGDFRKALEITRNSIKNGELKTEYINEGLMVEKHGFWKERLLEMPYHEALLLASIVQETLKHKGEVDEPPYLPVSWDVVKQTYLQACKQFEIKPHRDKMLYYWLEKLWLEQWIDKFTLSKSHEWNYLKKRGLFIRLKEKLENLVEPIKTIDWGKEW